MTVLITGGAGFIGSHTAHTMINNGVDPKDIIIIDDLSNGDEMFAPAHCPFYPYNISSSRVVGNIFKKHKIEPIIVPWRHRYFWDGGLHCITLDLNREGTQEDYFPQRQAPVFDQGL